MALAKALRLVHDFHALHARFGLSSDDCQFLLAFTSSKSLPETARAIGRDASVVSRRLARIAALAPVVEKRRDRWVLTALGVELNRWTVETAQSQRALLARPVGIRIGTTREFASRILVPGWAELVGAQESPPTVATFDSDIEDRLLSSSVDVAFECGHPRSPEVAFRLGLREPLVVCASPALVRRFKIRKARDVLPAPYLQYERIPAARLLGVEHELPTVAGRFNDIAVVREAVVGSIGWSLLPLYTVRDEVGSNRVRVFADPTIPEDHFGVWWLRGNRPAERWASHALKWLKTQSLG
jgi:DNA-binding transcriptional LysR family regulator